MSRRFHKMDRHLWRAALSLERLEDRQLLSGWAQPLIATPPSWPTWTPVSASHVQAAPPGAASPAPTSLSTPASDSSSETGENYNQAAVSSDTPADGMSSADPASSTAYARSAAANSSSAKSATTFGALNAAGGSYGAGVAGNNASSAGGSESAFSYYGQQPFYRLPPDQISAFRAGGADVPQPASDTQVLAAIVPTQDNSNSPGHGAADAASRRNTELVAVAVGSRGLGDQRPAGDFRTGAAAEEVPPYPLASTSEPERPDALAGPLVLGFLPNSTQVAVGMLPVDLAALERGVEQFFCQMATLGEHVSYLDAAQRLAPWLVAVALSTAALETARWRFWKPAPATPVLTSTARGFSTTHPSGTDLFPDLS